MRDVRIVEVGPRDGLQNEPALVPLAEKLKFIRALARAGLGDIEVGAWVRPDRVPQMADTPLVVKSLFRTKFRDRPSHYWTLIPNRKGLQTALEAGCRHIAVFTAVSESFSKANTGMSCEESLDEIRATLADLRAWQETAKRSKKIRVRGYVSTAFGCPFEGWIPAKAALSHIEDLATLLDPFRGEDSGEISIGDTIGVATPNLVEKVVRPALKFLSPKRVALHFHDTRGTALVNTLKALDLGARIFDSSAGGLGGCPFAPGATGNLATEDLVYLLNGLGLKTGVKLELLAKESTRLARLLDRRISSRVVAAYAANPRSNRRWLV